MKCELPRHIALSVTYQAQLSVEPDKMISKFQFSEFKSPCIIPKLGFPFQLFKTFAVTHPVQISGPQVTNCVNMTVNKNWG